MEADLQQAARRNICFCYLVFDGILHFSYSFFLSSHYMHTSLFSCSYAYIYIPNDHRYGPLGRGVCGSARSPPLAQVTERAPTSVLLASTNHSLAFGLRSLGVRVGVSSNGVLRTICADISSAESCCRV